MMLIALIILATAIIFLSQNKIVSIKYITLLFILTEVAINAGWILSEVGRQPWFFYGVLERTSVHEIEHLSSSIILLISNLTLLTLASFYSFKILIKSN